MPVLLIALLLGVLAYLWWKRTRTTLTRDCRWRQTEPGHWRCAFCGAEMDSEASPLRCLRPGRDAG